MVLTLHPFESIIRKVSTRESRRFTIFFTEESEMACGTLHTSNLIAWLPGASKKPIDQDGQSSTAASHLNPESGEAGDILLTDVGLPICKDWGVRCMSLKELDLSSSGRTKTKDKTIRLLLVGLIRRVWRNCTMKWTVSRGAVVLALKLRYLKCFLWYKGHGDL